MARHCGACSHPLRSQIDEELLAHDATYRALARKYGLEDDALRRHEQRHLHYSWRQSKELQALMQAERLVARIEEMERVADDVLAHGERTHDQRLRLLALREVRANVEMLLKIGVAAEFEQRMTRVLERIESPDGNGEGGTT